MMVGTRDDARFGTRGDHFPSIEGQRLLAEYMLAGCRRGERLRLVQFVGGADVDRVNGGAESTGSRLVL